MTVLSLIVTHRHKFIGYYGNNYLDNGLLVLLNPT